MEHGYNSIFEQYSDYKALVCEYLREYVQYADITADKLGRRADIHLEMPGGRLPFALSLPAASRVEALLKVINERTEKSEIFLPLDYLCGEFLMDQEEKIAFAACLMPYIYPELSEIYRCINNDHNTDCLTLACVCRIFLGSRPDAYNSFESFLPLLFDVYPSRFPLARTELKISERIIKLLLGQELLYDLPYSVTFAVTEEIDDIYGREKELSTVKNAVDRRSRIIFLIEGARGIGKSFFVKHIGKGCHRNIIFADLSDIPDDNTELSALELRRECIIQRALCCFENLNEQTADKARKLILSLEKTQNTIFLCSEKNIAFRTITPYRIKLSDLSYEDKAKIWESFGLPYENGGGIEKISASYDLTPGKIKSVISECETAAALDGAEIISERLIEQVCLGTSEDILKDKASRIKTSFKMDDLILPQHEKKLISEGINFIKFRHKVFDIWKFREKTSSSGGLSMLFEGSPGTGKTMAASIVANELGLPLFKVDLSKMMSKYIGETEKNLDEIFDTAEKSNAVLLFDETDALFGKRSEIKDSHDKYANVETSFLLQKLDEFSGAVIMTTNFKQNIDDAFMRRITFIIHFPQPDAGQREELWKSAFPKEAPLEKNTDIHFLAERFEMTGAMIKSAAISAAFSAAAKNKDISMADIVPAVKKQFAKFGKNITPADFGPYSAYADDTDPR